MTTVAQNVYTRQWAFFEGGDERRSANNFREDWRVLASGSEEKCRTALKVWFIQNMNEFEEVEMDKLVWVISQGYVPEKVYDTVSWAWARNTKYAFLSEPMGNNCRRVHTTRVGRCWLEAARLRRVAE